MYVEGIRRNCMVRMATRREACEHWNDDDICPMIEKRIKNLSFDSRTCRAFNSGGGHYEIKDGKSTLPVNLNERTCLCNAWQISGIPCKHGVRAILHNNEDPRQYCSEWYSCKRYKMAYSSSIFSIPDVEHWPEIDQPVINPPQMKRSIGRPKRNRKRDADEERKGKRSKTVMCSKCKCFGHNAKTCRGGLTAKEKRKTKSDAAKVKSKVPKCHATSSSQPLPQIRNTVRTRSMACSQPIPGTSSSRAAKGKMKTRC